MSGMDYQSFLNAIIDDGITEIPLAYPRPEQKDKRDGAIAGFNACRGLVYEQIGELLVQARTEREAAAARNETRYWWHRMYEAQIEWVLNVLSAVALNQGLPTLIPPTYRGIMKAADILGVKESV